MVVECVICLDYQSEEEAIAVHQAIEPDNYGFVESVPEGNRIKISSAAGTSMSLLHTIEDLLACVKVAEEAFRAATLS